MLDMRKLNERQVKELMDLYSHVCGSELQPLPNEFKNPKLRQKIDETFNKVLGLDVDLNPLYGLLSQDPTITGESLA